MPNKDRQKRSVRKARAAARKEREENLAASAPAEQKKGVLASKAKPEAKKAVAKKDAPKKEGPFKGIRTWFGGVRSEMKRVTWPSKQELKNYSVAVVAMLIVFGVVVAIVDTGVVAALMGYSGLRG